MYARGVIKVWDEILDFFRKEGKKMGKKINKIVIDKDKHCIQINDKKIPLSNMTKLSINWEVTEEGLQPLEVEYTVRLVDGVFFDNER